MSRFLLAFLAILSVGVDPARLVTASEPPPDGVVRATVTSVLSAETESRQPLDRRALLRGALEQNPEAESARWQSGYVEVAGEWRPFEETPAAIQDNALRDEYHTLRNAAGQNTDDQVRLANWCKAKGLVEQEWAHLTGALALAGDRDLPHVRHRLGHALVNGRWMSLEEQEQAERFVREMQYSMRRWGHRLQNITKRLSGSQRSRESAIADLNGINDPSVLPAAELILTNSDEDAALEWIRFFDQFDRYQASQVLARQAVFSRWPAARTAATQALRSRSREEFVPLLLTAMHRPAESRIQILYGPGGTLRWTHVCAREMADRWEIARYSLTDFVVDIRVPGRNRRMQGLLNNPPIFRILNAAASADSRLRRVAARRNDILRRAHDDLYRREAILAQHNEAAEEHNARISAVLAESTGQTLTTDPRVWWARWFDELDVEPAAQKPLVVVDEQERFLPVGRVREVPLNSCLVGGTPVRTERGLTPIEQIEIGDLVLSKDIETGELAYKPVVLTTVREAPRIVRLTTGEESLDLTSGHLVWVSGAGWTKARSLTSGQPLHTTSGTVCVDSVQPLGSGTVYNLVVADFHTYFFGETMILSHDVTIPALTNVVVPGLPPEHSHAE